MYPGVMLKDFDHVQVILDTVQADPGKVQFVCVQVPVIGLVHMPDKGKIKHWKIIIQVEIKVKKTKNPRVIAHPGVFAALRQMLLRTAFF
jgi:hypothetical protein